jgi:hypothetical protein
MAINNNILLDHNDMRYSDFANFPQPLKEETLNELNMSPSSLEKFLDSNVDLFIGGFEAECLLPGGLHFEEKPDMSYDERIDGRTSMDDIYNFFNLDNYSRGWRRMNSEYEDWVESKVNEYIGEYLEREMEEMADKHNSNLDEEDWESPSYFEDDARDYLKEQAHEKQDLSVEAFMWDVGHLDHYSEIGDYYDLEWPYHSTDEKHFDVEVAEEQSEELSNNYLGKTVIVNDKYHGRRHSDAYVIEPDESVKDKEDSEAMGMEIISYPMPLEEMMDDLESVFRYIDHNCYTNDTTGLHINLSFKEGGIDNLDYVKLILFLGDDYVLRDFERESNTYAESSLQSLMTTTRGKYNRNVGDIARSFELLKQGLAKEAGSIIATRNFGKYYSVNMKNGYIEFRSMGGDYITKWESIKIGIMRFVQAMQVASDPMAERKAYALKLYKLLSKDGSPDFKNAVQAFTLYNGDIISKDSLVTYLRKLKNDRTQ